jgi:cytochrome c peroxidase
MIAVLPGLLLPALLLLRAAAIGQDQAGEGVADEPITPVPLATGLDPARVHLGEKLFQDVALSHGDLVSCASCHLLAHGGDDDHAHHIGTDGRPLDFNAPTIFNVTLNSRFNWRGNFQRLERQNEAALHDPRLMNMTWRELLEKLRANPDYRSAFARAYGAAPEPRHLLDALAAFERSLLTPARFDRYLRGERGAITPAEERGYQLFKSYGCVACHQGVNIGGNLFQKFGIFEDPFANRETITRADLGRFTITGAASDRHVFRVPSLRNVALTAPYLHDGSAQTLEQAVAIMGRSQLGRTIPAPDIERIVAFLRTLTGEYQGGFWMARSVPDHEGRRQDPAGRCRARDRPDLPARARGNARRRPARADAGGPAGTDPQRRRPASRRAAGARGVVA